MFLFSMPGATEWIVILVVALLLFGKRLPEVARGLGQSITEFKRGLQNITDDISIATQNAEKSHKQNLTDNSTIPPTTNNNSESKI